MSPSGGASSRSPRQKPRAQTRPRHARVSPELSNFYTRAVTEAEREALDRAAGVEGLDDEIAMLRAKLHSALRDHPEEVGLLLKGITTLSGAVSTRYRLSGKAEQSLVDTLLGTLRGLSSQLLPEDEEPDNFDEEDIWNATRSLP